MTKFNTMAFLAASAFALTAVPAQAQYRASPAQSLSGSCQDIETQNSGYVTAICRANDGRWRWSSIYYPHCRSDVANRDGVLSCVGAQGSAGNYMEPRSSGQTGQTGQTSVGAIVGMIAGALMGGNDQTLYQPGSRYPVWGERGYGDPRTDPRFGEQGWGYGSQGQWVSISRRQAWLERRISQGEQQRRLTRSEASVLRRELSMLITLERRYSAGGLSVRERADLDRRFDALSLRIRLERRDGDGGWTNINQRQAQLDARIDAGVRNGSISNQEAMRLRAEFQSIARQEADYRQDGLTNAERADLDRRFDALSARIQADGRDDDGRWTNINQRQANLDARIDAGVRNGSISSQEASRLRAEFQAIARLEADYRQGGLTNAERDDLDRRFDALSARIQADGRDDDGGWTNIDQRQAQLDRRIDAGVRNGSISSQEASRLRAEFQAIARQEADYRQGGLTNAERAELERRFDALSARIQADGRDDDGGWTSIDQRQARLDARIDAGVRNGSISSQEASRLRAEFQAIARQEADYRQGGLTNAERAELERRFDALSASIQADGRDDDGGWTSIDQRQAALDDRIEAGVRNGSITSEEARRLRDEFDAIARLEADYRQGGLTNAERDDLNRRFEALSARIRADGRDDDGGWTSINQRQAELDDRIEAGVRNGSITSQEARRLRDEFDGIARLEDDYRQGGLSIVERADLDRRFDELSERINAVRRSR